MSADRIIIRHLAFTGPQMDAARLEFDPGLNVIYGASDTGKSFTAKALNFMMAGTSKLPHTDEVKRYTAIWLGLTLPGKGDVTLYRAIRGGDFRMYEGLVDSGDGPATDLSGSADSGRTETVSHLLLDAIGWSGKEIVKNANAEKTSLAIRNVLPYVIVSETDIMSEADPVHYSRQYTNETFESNLLRFVLTGQDDSAAVTVVGTKAQKVATTAKIELVDEWIAQVDEELGENPPDRKELADQLARLANTLAGLQNHMRAAQERLDSLVRQRRGLIDQRLTMADRLAELSLALERFGLLYQTYATDRERLQSLEESGYLLLARADRDCAVCGAPPDAQRHRHTPEEFTLALRAATAEARKIELEQRDLQRTVVSIEVEGAELQNTVTTLRDEIEAVEKNIEEARPLESSTRSEYAELLEERAELERIEDLYHRRDRLAVRRSQLDSIKPTKSESKLTTGIDGTTAFELGQKVIEVLDAWKFPGAKQAQFNLDTSDITIAGKSRADNGKGVRAILHAAFNVALLLYCRDKRLPHPGFLVLDTPLLTYREPMTSRHGELAVDEAQMKTAPVAANFYEHLIGISAWAQVIVLENADPPSDFSDRANVQIFTGRRGGGRHGLFPPLDLPPSSP